MHIGIIHGLFRRLKWIAMMVFGWCCYWLVLVLPAAWLSENRFYDLLVSNAGFYAYDTGYDNYKSMA